MSADERVQAGLILRLDVSKWSGSAKLEADDLGLAPADVQAAFALGRKRLVEKAANDPIDTVAARAKYLLETLSHRLPDGSRFILAAAAPEVLVKLRAQRDEFMHAVDTFLAAYPTWREAMQPEWRAAAEKAYATQAAKHPALPHDAFVAAFLARVDAAYPTADELRGKYDFMWYTYAFRAAGLHEVDMAVAAAEEERRREQDAAYEAEVRGRINEALDRSIGQLHASIAEAFGNVLEHVRSGRAVREGSIERLRRTIARFRALNLFGADSVESAIRQFEEQALAPLSAGRTVADLGETFTSGLADVVRAATVRGAAVSSLSGRLRRSFGGFADDDGGDDASAPETSQEHLSAAV